MSKIYPVTSHGDPDDLLRDNVIIGITGSSGSGKTTLANRIQETFANYNPGMRLEICSIDEITHDVFADEENIAEIKKMLHELEDKIYLTKYLKDIIFENGKLDARKLGDMIYTFRHDDACKPLSSFIWNEIELRVDAILEEFDDSKYGILILDWILLHHTEYWNRCHCRVLTYSISESTRRQYTKCRDGLTETEFEERDIKTPDFSNTAYDIVIRTEYDQRSLDDNALLVCEYFNALRTSPYVTHRTQQFLNTAFYSGTFDPFTKGHKYIIVKALDLVDQLVVGINMDSGFSGKKRISSAYDMASAMCKVFIRTMHPSFCCRIMIAFTDTLPSIVAKKMGAITLIRGVRDVGDYVTEERIAQYNQAESGLNTLFLRSGSDMSHISSTAARIALHNKYDHNYLIKHIIDPEIAYICGYPKEDVSTGTWYYKNPIQY